MLFSTLYGCSMFLMWCKTSFRLLAHAKVETVKLKEAAEQRRNRNKSWFSFGRFENYFLFLVTLANDVFVSLSSFFSWSY